MSDTPTDNPTPDNGGNPDPAPTPEWSSAFEGETLGWLQNRGITGKPVNEALQNLVEGFRATEQRLGVPADRVLRLPVDPSAEGAMDEVYARLGRPETADGYGIEIPEDASEQEKAFATGLLNQLHKTGLTAAQATNLYGFLDEQLASISEAAEEAAATANQAALDALQAKWGSDYEMHKATAMQTVAALDVPEEQINALEKAMGSSAAVVEFFANLGARRSTEHGFETGDGSTTGRLTPEAAQSRKSELMGDENFRARLRAKDADAKKQIKDLNAIIAKGMTR